MRHFRQALMVLVPVAVLGGCTSMSDQDRALLTSANENAEQAKAMAQQALDASKAAQASANNAAQSANEARTASERSDRMFQRSLRKTGTPQSGSSQ